MVLLKKIFIIIGVLILLISSLFLFVFTNENIKRDENYLKLYLRIEGIDSISMYTNAFSSNIVLIQNEEELVEILQIIDICNVKYTQEETFDDSIFCRNDTIFLGFSSSKDDSLSYVVFSNGTIAKIDYENKCIWYGSINTIDYEKLSVYL